MVLVPVMEACHGGLAMEDWHEDWPWRTGMRTGHVRTGHVWYGMRTGHVRTGHVWYGWAM